MIIKNGKRIDGCSDTVPIGTLNPFLGTKAPYGYLICQGQKVSKTVYKELYEICGDTFGQSTNTEFYLPDLRGQTIAGYKEGDSTFGTLGGLIGSLTHLHDFSHTHNVPGVAHTHTTGNHILTVNEMPSHSHIDRIAWGDNGKANVRVASGRDVAFSVDKGDYTANTGGSQPHNHGNTGSTTPSATTTNSQSKTNTSSVSNVQPTITLNWIVKAFQLMPNQSYVSNLESNSKENTYSCDFINTLVSEVKSQVLDSAFPIGKIEVFFDNEDHSNYLGFTWERELEGLTPIGYNPNDTDFDTIGKTLGNKTIDLSHTHSYAHTHGVPGVAHVHSTGNHTLTVNEMPSHNHSIKTFVYTGTGPYGHTESTQICDNGSLEKEFTQTSYSSVGGSQPHNHGNTGSTTPNATTTNSQSTTTTSSSGSTIQSIIQPSEVVAYWRRIA